MNAAPTDALGEAARNRVLRRADWRYLLPDPAPRRALCLATGALREACEIVAERVDSAPASGEQYDLVVAEDPDDATLRTFASALVPDGACYTEWSARTPGAVARVRRALDAAGLRDARSYRPWPSVDQCRAWVPTEGDAARWWWRSATEGTDVRRQQLRAAVGALQSRLGAHGRIGVVAHGIAAPAPPRLLALAAEYGALARAGEDASMILLTPGARSVGKVIMLPFGADGMPSVAIKTARIADAARGLRREADLLDVVHAQHGELRGAPHVLFRDRVLDTTVVGESALNGVPLLARIDARSYGSIVERVAEWLVTLATPPATPKWRSVWEHLARPAFERFTAEFGALVEHAQLTSTRDVLAALGTLPVVVEQRDCSPWNVFERDGSVFVLDWESGVEDGVPALDLIYFITHAAFYVEGAWVSGRFEDAYRAAWSRQSEIGQTNHGCIARYLERVGVPADLLPALRLLAWVIHAHSDWVHRRDDAGAEPSMESLRDSRFLRLYRAELAAGDL